jgi:hypothetical protein
MIQNSRRAKGLRMALVVFSAFLLVSQNAFATTIGTNVSTVDLTASGTTTLSGTLDVSGTISTTTVQLTKEAPHTLKVADTTTAATAGGALTISAGAGSTSGNGGAAALNGGAAGATGTGGALSLTSGAGGATSGASGAVTVASGTTTSSQPL